MYARGVFVSADGQEDGVGVGDAERNGGYVGDLAFEYVYVCVGIDVREKAEKLLPRSDEEIDPSIHGLGCGEYPKNLRSCCAGGSENGVRWHNGSEVTGILETPNGFQILI